MSDWTLTGQTGQMENGLYPIGDLQKRYGLTSRQAVYDRIKALKIEPAARGKLSSDQLDKLDKLDEHLKSGGTMSDFADVANGYAVARSALAPLPKELAEIPQNSQTTLTIGELTKRQPIADLDAQRLPVSVAAH